MQHAQKLVLVPKERLEKLQKNQDNLPTIQTPGDNITRTDAEMHKLLNDSKTSDIEKAKLYTQLLQKFLFQKGMIKEKVIENENDNLLDMENNFSILSDISEVEKTVTNGKNSEDIVSSVPKAYRVKANGIMKHLLRSGDVDYNEKLELVFKNQVISGTNITDLVNDAVRKRKTAPVPKGRTFFAKALASVHMPFEFIGNEDVKKLINVENNQPTLTPSPPLTRTRMAAITSTPTSSRPNNTEDSFVDAEETVQNWSRLKKK